jgi:hypothetical protein
VLSYAEKASGNRPKVKTMIKAGKRKMYARIFSLSRRPRLPLKSELIGFDVRVGVSDLAPGMAVSLIGYLVR